MQAGPQADIPRIKKKDVLRNLERGCWINIAGMVSTLLGLQATVGLLVAKTLTNATANPFLSGGAGSYNPVLALDVFQVQVSNFSNITLAGLSLWAPHCFLWKHPLLLQIGRHELLAGVWCLGMALATRCVSFEISEAP